MLKMPKPYSQLTDVLALGIAALGLLVSASWIIGFEPAKSLFADRVTMKFSTSICFIATGLVLLAVSRHLSQKKGAHSLFEIVLPSCLLVILLFMVTHITSVLLSTASGLDNLFVKEGSDAIYTVSPGRPSLGTISSFLLVVAGGAATVIIPRADTRSKFLAGIGSALGIIGGLALAGYAFGLPELFYSIPGSSTAMAVNTALLFVTAGIAFVLLSRHDLNSISKPEQKQKLSIKQVSIRTKLITLFLVVSLIPIIFIGTIFLNNAKTLPNSVLAGSVTVLGITALVSAVFIAFIISRSISTPITSLRNAANLIASGNYDTKLPVGNLDELAQLAIDFEKMKGTIISTNKNLERLVELRTAELTDSNKQLELANKQLLLANERLRVQEAAMKDFVSLAAHELRNPIAPILLAASLVERNHKQQESDNVSLTRDEFRMIIRNAERLKRLAEDILDVTRIENHSLNLNKETFNLAALITSVINDSKKLYEVSNIEISYEATSGNAILVEADKGKIVQVLSNLLTNAIKFTREGKIKLGVEVENSTGQVVISVKDNGDGIDFEILPQLFTKFATKSDRGMGLGLYISKSIVEAHGGRIWATNNEGEKGATFSFSLNLAKMNGE